MQGVDQSNQITQSVPDRDLLDIHEAVLREAPDPGEGREIGPWWLWLGILIAIFSGGYYLGRFSGTFFGDEVHVGYLSRGRSGDFERAMGSGSDAEVVSGETIFAKNCASCHQANGQGVPGAFPPLVGAGWATGDPGALIRILLHGLTGPVEVQGSVYNGAMPAWGPSLSNEEIAAVASYVRSAWGNSASPIEPEAVAALREALGQRGPWTAAELEGLGGAE